MEIKMISFPRLGLWNDFCVVGNDSEHLSRIYKQMKLFVW